MSNKLCLRGCKSRPCESAGADSRPKRSALGTSSKPTLYTPHRRVSSRRRRPARSFPCSHLSHGESRRVLPFVRPWCMQPRHSLYPTWRYEAVQRVPDHKVCKGRPSPLHRRHAVLWAKPLVDCSRGNPGIPQGLHNRSEPSSTAIIKGAFLRTTLRCLRLRLHQNHPQRGHRLGSAGRMRSWRLHWGYSGPALADRVARVKGAANFDLWSTRNFTRCGAVKALRWYRQSFGIQYGTFLRHCTTCLGCHSCTFVL